MIVHFTIQLRRAGFDIRVSDPDVFHIPVELAVKLVAISDVSVALRADSKVFQAEQYLAVRLVSIRMDALSAHAVDEEMEVSQSLRGGDIYRAMQMSAQRPSGAEGFRSLWRYRIA